MNLPDDELVSIDEDARRRFEKAIRQQSEVDLEQFLPSVDSKLYQATLEELIMIDLERRWSLDSTTEKWEIERYLDRYPTLTDPSTIRRLVEEELRMRVARGETPSVLEYRRRFPELDFEETFCNVASNDTLPIGPGQLPDEVVNKATVSDQPVPNRYAVQNEFAAGGMGVIYRATDQSLGREIAIKQLKSDLGNPAECRARFLNEARLTSRLQHPGVVPVYDLAIADDGMPFYAMKLVEGQTLRDLIHEHHEKRLDDGNRRKLINVLISVAKTVAYAHDRQVIHRDLKPANIVVGKFGETVVLDWGLAKDRRESESERDQPAIGSQYELSGELTMTGSVLGTPAYMAPEQAKGRINQIDERSDIYGLGAILFHLLTGSTPAGSLDDLHDQMIDGSAPTPRSKNPSIPKSLNAVCSKAMNFKRDLRYQNANEFATDLESYLNDEAVSVYAEPVSVRLGRWARRHRTLVTSSAACILLMVAASVVAGFSYQAAVADREREVATRRASIEQSETTGLAEAYDGRFVSARDHFAKALELAGDDLAFYDERNRIGEHITHCDALVKFQEVSKRGEDLGWNDQDEDAVLLLQRALAHVHVFKQWDWWNHLTPIPISPAVEHELRQQVYHDLCLLVAMRLHWGMLAFNGPIEFAMGTNREARQRFSDALIPIEAAQRYRPAVGLEFAEALCRGQAGGLAEWNKLLQDEDLDLDRLTDPRELMNPVDKYFIGMCLLYYGIFEEDTTDPIVRLSKPFLRFENPYDSSIAMLRESSAQRPDHYYTVFAYGWAAQEVQDHDRALVAFSRCIVISPDSYDAYNERALQYLWLGHHSEDPEAAREYYRRALADVDHALSLAPAESYVYWRKGEALSQLPDSVASVLAAWIQAAAFSAPNEEALQFSYHRDARRNHLEPALEYARSAIDVLPDIAEPYLLAAICSWRLGDREVAEDYLQQALERWPQSAVGAVIQGEMSLADGEFEKAREHFVRARDLDDSLFLAHRGIAIVELEDPDSDAAVAAYSRLVDRAQNDWQRFEALSGRAIASIGVGATDQALADVERILWFRPSNPCTRIREAAEASEDERLLERLDELLSNRSPQPTRPSLNDSGYAALLNGDFELSLINGWESDAERPSIWWNEGGCRSEADRALRTSHEGDYSLRIRNLSPKQDGVFGRLSQSVPTEPGREYRLSFHAKSDGLSEDAIAIRIIDHEDNVLTEIKLEAGTSDWQEHSSQFGALDDSTRVEIVSQNQGTTWIDAMTLESLPQ